MYLNEVFYTIPVNNDKTVANYTASRNYIDAAYRSVRFNDLGMRPTIQTKYHAFMLNWQNSNIKTTGQFKSFFIARFFHDQLKLQAPSLHLNDLWEYRSPTRQEGQPPLHTPISLRIGSLTAMQSQAVTAMRQYIALLFYLRIKTDSQWDWILLLNHMFHA